MIPNKARHAVLEKIREVFFEVEKDYPEKSVEWQFQMTCDAMRIAFRLSVDHGDVAEALSPE